LYYKEYVRPTTAHDQSDNNANLPPKRGRSTLAMVWRRIRRTAKRRRQPGDERGI